MGPLRHVTVRRGKERLDHCMGDEAFFARRSATVVAVAERVPSKVRRRYKKSLGRLALREASSVMEAEFRIVSGRKDPPSKTSGVCISPARARSTLEIRPPVAMMSAYAPIEPAPCSLCAPRRFTSRAFSPFGSRPSPARPLAHVARVNRDEERMSSVSGLKSTPNAIFCRANQAHRAPP